MRLQDYPTEALHAELQRRQREPLVELLNQVPRLTYIEIGKLLGISPSVVTYHAQALVKAGTIQPRYRGVQMPPTVTTAKKLAKIKQLQARGKTYDQIAAAMGCTRQNVKATITNHWAYFEQMDQR